MGTQENENQTSSKDTYRVSEKEQYSKYKIQFLYIKR
jgi:hypothetical protein